MITDDIIHIVYRDIFNPVLFLPLSPLFSADEINNGRILTSQIIFRLKTTLSNQKETGQHRFQVKKGEHIPHIMK